MNIYLNVLGIIILISILFNIKTIEPFATKWYVPNISRPDPDRKQIIDYRNTYLTKNYMGVRRPAPYQAVYQNYNPYFNYTDYFDYQYPFHIYQKSNRLYLRNYGYPIYQWIYTNHYW